MKTERLKVYLASGWFNKQQDEELTAIEELTESMDWLKVISPRKVFVCPPNAPKHVQAETFDGNLMHIETSGFVICNTRDKDLGTIWEAGYAFANKIPLVYFCAGLTKGAKFNLMLARSGIKVVTSIDELKDYLERSYVAGYPLVEPYSASIE